MLLALIEQSSSLEIMLFLPRTNDGTAVNDFIVTLAADLNTY
jgi:hypothetical protein